MWVFQLGASAHRVLWLIFFSRMKDLDQLADEEVERLKNDMIAAADADQDANENKKPATEKLKLLPKVVNTLQKYA